MISKFIKGGSDYLRAFSFLMKHRLFGYVLISGLISIVLASVIFGAGWYASDDIGGYLSSFYPWEWGASIVHKILNVVSGTAIIAFGLIIFKYALLICISPFMGPLSTKVETIITNRSQKEAFSIKQMSYEIMRGVRISLRNIVRELSYTLLLLLLGFIPFLSIFITPLIFLVQGYYAGFASFDYFLERRASVKQSVRYNKQHRPMVIGNGSVFLLLLFIPILGWFLAPILGTIAATMTALEDGDYPEMRQ